MTFKTVTFKTVTFKTVRFKTRTFKTATAKRVQRRTIQRARVQGVHSRRARLQRAGAVFSLFVLAALSGVSVAASASGSIERSTASAGVVVSQVYAGGGNAGAAFANDYVELFNRGSAAVDVGSWTLQYAPAAGTGWQTTALSGSIAPGRFYLVSLASTAAVGAALPKSDAAGTTNLAASGGKVALVRGAAALTCGAAAGSCSSNSLVADLVGYGSAADFEGKAPAPGLDGTTAALRAGGGCTDTDSSSTDFAAGPPAPHNSASAAVKCPGAPAQGDDDGKGVGVNLDVQPVLSISLEQSTLNFGKVAPGSTPTPLAEHVTVVSNDPAGYSLKVHRSAFAPGDLPLAISATAPGKATLGPALAGGVLAPIPVAPAADLLLGTAAAAGAGSGRYLAGAAGLRIGAARRGRRSAHGHRHVHGDRPVRLRPAFGSAATAAVLAFGPATGPLLGAVAGAGPAGVAVGVTEPRAGGGRRPRARCG